MSDYYRYCARCGNPQRSCRCPEGFQHRHQGKPATVLEAYVNLRADCIALEELMAEQKGKDLDRLDKAVTVMKVGFKLVKKVLRSQGATGNLKAFPDGPTDTVQ